MAQFDGPRCLSNNKAVNEWFFPVMNRLFFRCWINVYTDMP